MKNITYIDIMPYEIQDKIWKNVHNFHLQELHRELNAEICNDIPSDDILVYDNPTLYMKKLTEVLNIISSEKNFTAIEAKILKYLNLFLNYYNSYAINSEVTICDFTIRGHELFNIIYAMNEIIYRIRHHDLRDYNILVIIKNSLTFMTYHELVAFKMLLLTE